VKRLRQRFFIARELRLSIALIVLWSLLVVAFLAFLIKNVSEYMGLHMQEEIGPGVLLLVMAAYGAFVVFFSGFFAHRFLGPFVRLKIEIRRILGGEYANRLYVRKQDDPYIRSFIEEVNRILDRFEQLHAVQESIRRKADSIVMTAIAGLEKQEITKEEQRRQLIALHTVLKEMLPPEPELEREAAPDRTGSGPHD